MCGRFNLADSPAIQTLLDELGVATSFNARFNLAPTDPVPVVRSVDQKNELRQMRWWLVPAWTDQPSSRFAMFNARVERVSESPAFKQPFRTQRCILPASSYIEWRKQAGVKQALEIVPTSGWFAFAGLWELWRRGPEKIYSCTILTTEAAPNLAEIHPRQPVMLKTKQFERWLDPDIDGSDLKDFLKPPTEAEVSIYQLDSTINNSRNKNPPQRIAAL